MMKVLVACEESQAVTIELRRLGHEAYSADIQDCSGGHPEWHIKGDLMKAMNVDRLQAFGQFWTEAGTVEKVHRWDMIIAFPPCTFLTVTGNRWFNEERYGDKAVQRKKDRVDAISFFMAIANADCDKIAIENPSIQTSLAILVINEYEYRHAFKLSYQDFLDEPLDVFTTNLNIMSIKNSIEAKQYKKKVIK